MNITQNRYKLGDDFTLSHLYLDGLMFKLCPYILEDAVREKSGMTVSEWKVKNETAIPYGTYLVKKTFSQRFGKLMYQLMDVPGFEGVRIHSGNTSHDTEGCLITGRERDEKNGEVSGSRVARDALYDRMDKAVERGETIYWTIKV